MDNGSISLSKLVGENVFAKIPAYKANTVVTLKLLAVEVGGIWVESHDFMEDIGRYDLRNASYNDAKDPRILFTVRTNLGHLCDC